MYYVHIRTCVPTPTRWRVVGWVFATYTYYIRRTQSQLLKNEKRVGLKRAGRS